MKRIIVVLTSTRAGAATQLRKGDRLPRVMARLKKAAKKIDSREPLVLTFNIKEGQKWQGFNGLKFHGIPLDSSIWRRTVEAAMREKGIITLEHTILVAVQIEDSTRCSVKKVAEGKKTRDHSILLSINPKKAWIQYPPNMPDHPLLKNTPALTPIILSTALGDTFNKKFVEAQPLPGHPFV